MLRFLRRSDFAGALFAGILVLLFSFLLLWRDPLVFWNDDYQISILPVFADVARSWSEGQLPLLSPYSWVCNNLAGEFQYGTFSVFINALVVMIWKFPLAFAQQAAALSMAHLFVLAMGSYLLARDRKLSPPLCIMVALVSSLNGWIICWGATDWFGALSAFAWLPWAWWALERALDPARGRWRYIWPAPFVYLVVSGGFPYTVGMLGLLISWLTLRSLGQTRSLWNVMPLVAGTTLGLGLSSPAWLALFAYVHGSAREAQPASTHFQWIVPPAALPAFILPCWTAKWADFWTHLTPHTGAELTCGLVPPVALAAGLFKRGRQLVRKIKWELGLTTVVLLIAMLPSANVFRWSFRWLPFLHLLLVVCAAEALVLLDKTRIGLVAVTFVMITTLVMYWCGTAGKYAVPFAWITLVLAFTWSFLELLPSPSNRIREWIPALVVFVSLLVTYLCIPTNPGVPKFPLSEELLQPTPLHRQRLYLGLYSPPELSYTKQRKPEGIGQVLRPGSTSMWAGLHFINGYSPVCPSGVAREFGFAIHGELQSGMNDYLAHWQATPDGTLAQLGVDGLVIARELGITPTPAMEWELVYSSSEGDVFHRRGKSLSRVRSLTSVDSRPNAQFALAEISRVIEGRNSISADVAVPAGNLSALLTVSRPYFGGYHAKIDNLKLKVDSYRGLIPTIELPPGIQGRMTLTYRPTWLVVGGVIAGLSLLVLLVGSWRAIATQYTSRL